jgi:hypothetical protein
VLLVLMLLAVDFGRLFFTYIAVNNAAREGAAYAAEHARDTSYDPTLYQAGVTASALQEANMQAQGGEGAASVSPPRCFTPSTGVDLDCHAASAFAGGTGNHVTVSVAQPFDFLTPVIGSLFGGSLDLTASATAPVLNPLHAEILPGPSVPPVPTPTPTATPTPSPTPSPTPTLPAGATPTPTPAPTPAPTPTPPPTCVVPDFKGGFWNNTGGIPALQVWQQAGFTGALTNQAGTEEIKRQTINKKSTVLCSSSMTVDDK